MEIDFIRFAIGIFVTGFLLAIVIGVIGFLVWKFKLQKKYQARVEQKFNNFKKQMEGGNKDGRKPNGSEKDITGVEESIRAREREISELEKTEGTPEPNTKSGERKKIRIKKTIRIKRENREPRKDKAESSGTEGSK